MKRYYPYAPNAPTPIYGEEHVIENGQILLNHIPLADSIEIEGFRQTNSAVLVANQFYCAYGSEYYYREANCIVRFSELHNGETVRVKYQQVGTIITANDMNEIKAHLENSDLHSSFVLPAATTETRGGIRVGHGLSISDDVLSADADNYTLPSATPLRLGGVVVESDENISRTIERYFPTAGETLPVHTQTIATRDSLGVVKIGDGLSITEDGLLTADAQDFTLTPATADSLGGVKVGDGLSIDANGVLSADAQDFTLTAATADSLGGVMFLTDEDVESMIESYFGVGSTDTTSPTIIGGGSGYILPIATAEKLGGVKIGARLSIDSLGVLSADTVQTYTLTAATSDSLGGVFVESDENISRTIQKYFPTVSADEIAPVLTSLPVATNESLGGIIVGEGLTISENGILSAEAQTFTLTPATADSLGGIKVGDGLSITGSGVLTALAQDFTLTAATTSSLGGVKIESDENVATMIENYFPSDWEFVPALTSIPPATAESLGGVIVGDGLSITGGGVLSALAQDFTLKPATSGSLGGVKIGARLTITEDGILSADAQNYSLPTASSSVKGGIKIGRGLTMTGETLSADAQDFTLTAATTDSLGGVKIVDDSIIAAMLEEYFPTVCGETIAPLYSIPAATADSLGGIKVGKGLSITKDGILSADSVAPYTLPAASDEEISSMIEEYFPESLTPEPFTLPAATRASLGGIIVGDRLTISNSGVLSANDQSYTLPTASASTKGGIKIGKGLIMTGETLSANADNYTLPTASSSQLGGVRIGNTLSMSSSGVLNYNLPNATSAALGGVIAGNTLTITNGTLNYNLPTASASQLGGVKVGNGLTITNGVLSANATDYTLPVAGDEEISSIIQKYFAYTVVGGD